MLNPPAPLCHTQHKKYAAVFARGPDNGIIAVYSLSKDTPLKTAGFALADKDFEGKTKYSEWQFVALPKQ